MTKNYSICGKRISIESQLPITEHENFSIFVDEEGKPDIEITYNIVESLPKIPGEPKKAKNGSYVSFEKDTVFRNTPMGVEEGALSCYSLDDPYKSQVYFTKESYSCMSDYRYMWNSVSLGQLLLPFKVLLFHSSYISFNNSAILFSAECGVGKSTQAELWRRHMGAEIINGDKAGVSVEETGVFAHGIPFCGTSGICKNKTLPLKAIVLLSQAPENKITRLNGVMAIQKLMSNIYLDFIAPGETQQCVDALIELLKAVPVYYLQCTPDEKAVECLAKELGITNYYD